jgi:peptide deformylase
LIRDIVRFGDPRLTAENADVDASKEDLSDLVADMVATCHAAPGVGLAAPQIGVSKRVAIIDLSVGADPDGLIVLVNPVVIESSGEQKE